jgi:uncharacterized membrane protein
MTVKTICRLIGFALLALGIASFRGLERLGLHSSTLHNVLYLLSGVLALYFGFVDSNQGARDFARIFGLAYLALGLLGFFAPGFVSLLLGFDEATARQLTPDNLVHLAIGTAFIAASLAPARGHAPRDAWENVRRG